MEFANGTMSKRRAPVLPSTLPANVPPATALASERLHRIPTPRERVTLITRQSPRMNRTAVAKKSTLRDLTRLDVDLARQRSRFLRKAHGKDAIGEAGLDLLWIDCVGEDE